MSNLKKPPYDQDAEESLIGSLLLDPINSIDKCIEVNLSSEAFYVQANRLIFETVMDMSKEGKAIDAVTIADNLKTNNILEKIGGFDHLIYLQDSLGVVGHVDHYAQIVIKHHRGRLGIDALGSAIDELYQSPDEPIRVIEEVAIQLDNIIPSKEDDRNDVEVIMDECEKALSGDFISIPTPFDSVNASTGGLRVGLVHVLTGRAKAGKSFLKATWLNYLGQKGIPTLDFCFEDRKTITLCRRAGQLGNYNAMRILNGGSLVHVGDGKFEKMPTTRDEIEKHRHFLNEVNKMPIYHYDKRCDINELHSVSSYYKRKHDIMMEFIDGAKDINRPANMYNNVGYEEAISQSMVFTASSLEIAVMPIYHLKKLDDDQLITMGSIRGSGNIASDARSIWALQSKGLDKVADKYGRYIKSDENGRQTTRRFDCLEINFGEECVKWLETDLGKGQFYED